MTAEPRDDDRWVAFDCRYINIDRLAAECADDLARLGIRIVNVSPPTIDITGPSIPIQERWLSAVRDELDFLREQQHGAAVPSGHAADGRSDALHDLFEAVRASAHLVQCELERLVDQAADLVNQFAHRALLLWERIFASRGAQ